MPSPEIMRKNYHPLQQIEGWLPEDYFLGDRGEIYRRNFNSKGDEIDGTLVIDQPLVICGLAMDHQEGNASIKLGYRMRTNWKYAWVPKNLLYNTHKIVDLLAPLGLNVSTDNALHVIRWLRRIERTVRGKVPFNRISDTIGWKRDRKDQLVGFMYGPHWVGSEEEIATFGSDNPEANQLAVSLQSKGEVSEWMSAVEPWCDNVIVKAGIAASLASPLLEILDLPGFVLDVAYKTSSGKSILMFMAASIWGKPGTVISSWSTTPVGLEYRAGLLRNIPLFCDDTKQVNRKKVDLGQVVYDLSSGYGKVRGSTTGLAKRALWRLVVWSTGEEPITDFLSGQGGGQARVVSIWGLPFGEKTMEKAKALKRAVAATKQNSGSVGEAWIAYLYTRLGSVPEWEARLFELADEYMEVLPIPDIGVCDRIASLLAVIHLAGEIAQEGEGSPLRGLPLIPEPKDLVSVLSNIDEPVGDVAADTFEWLKDYLPTIRSSFARYEGQWSETAPGGKGWLGWWPDETCPPKIFNHAVDFLLKERGVKARTMMRTWAELGWIESDKGTGLGKKARIPGMQGTHRITTFNPEFW